MNRSIWLATGNGLTVVDLPMRVPGEDPSSHDELQASRDAIRQIRRSETHRRFQVGLAAVLLIAGGAVAFLL